MQFYLTTEGVYVTRQADAGKGFTSVEVPTTKPELVVWLNENLVQKSVQVEEEAAPPPPRGGPECPRCKMTYEAAAQIARMRTTDAVAAMILSENRYDIAKLTEAVIEKLQDLKDGASQS